MPPRVPRRLSLCLLPFALLPAAAALAQSGNPAPMPPLKDPDPRVSSTLAAMSKAHSFSGVALSPDGSQLAWIANESSTIHLLDGKQIEAGAQTGTQTATQTGSGDTRPGSGGKTAVGQIIPAPPGSDPACRVSAPLWSPDSQTLAYTSTCTGTSPRPDQSQIYLWSRSTNQTRELTHLKGLFQDAAWSPDGQSIAFLFVENATRSAGALAAMKPWSGVVGEDGVEVQRVYGVDVASGRGNWISADRNLHVFEFGWAPDSRNLTYAAAPAPGENNWWVSKLYTQSIGQIAVCDAERIACISDGAPMGAPTVVFDPNTTTGDLHGLQIANPRWSPDGKQIAFIAGLMSDQGSTGGDIYTVPSSGGTDPKTPTGRNSAADVSADRTVSPSWFTWTSPTEIRVVARASGKNRIALWNVRSKQQLPGAQTVVGGVGAGGADLSLANSGAYAFASSSFEAPPEIFFAAGPTSAPRPITSENAGLQPVWGKSESVEWTNDGFHVQGWLLYPAGYDATKQYPLIVDVHGGPSAAMGARWGEAPTLYSSLGYFVFLPNPRGSFGQGENFVQANVKDFGYGDLSDILSGLDTLEARIAAIDRNREGLTGWSYGGFMTMFAVTQTQRFHAAVAGAGISDWKSYYGENSIDQWMLPFFGATVYDDPKIYARSSAIEYIKNVHTPTLVLVGDRDGECPAPQSFEFWHALRAEGVKTQLVVYPNEGHRFVDPAHTLDRAERSLQWFGQNMPAGGQ